MTFYIPPFALGVIVTLLIEFGAIVVYGIIRKKK